MLQSSFSKTIAIIGGGFSGTMVAVHLLRQANQPLSIKLIERRSSIGPGLAYSTHSDHHLLNVPVGKISAFPNQPLHFLNWLQNSFVDRFADKTTIHADSFVPRQLYGQYLQAVLTEVQTMAKAEVQFEVIHDEAIDIYAHGIGATIQLRSGQKLNADQVVLALGNFPPTDPPVLDSAFYRSSRYISHPWAEQAMQQIDRDQPILLIGSGLTMVDWAVALHHQGFRQKIYVVSRRGLLPQTHQLVPPYYLTLAQPEQLRSIRLLLQWLRQEIQFAEQQGYDWRSVIDALRPHLPIIWQLLPLAEQRRFLRHVQPYWEVHRHRTAPEIGVTIDHLLNCGQMRLLAGRIQSYQEQPQGVEVRLQARSSGNLVSIKVGRVVNCTGSTTNYCKLRHPFVEALLKTGLVQSDAIGLGLDVANNGALIHADGQTSSWLFTLGSAQKGTLWETTAVPELRQQAANLAVTLLQSFSHQLSVSESYQISRSKSFRYSNAL